MFNDDNGEKKTAGVVFCLWRGEFCCIPSLGASSLQSSHGCGPHQVTPPHSHTQTPTHTPLILPLNSLTYTPLTLNHRLAAYTHTYLNTHIYTPPTHTYRNTHTDTHTQICTSICQNTYTHTCKCLLPRIFSSVILLWWADHHTSAHSRGGTLQRPQMLI